MATDVDLPLSLILVKRRDGRIIGSRTLKGAIWKGDLKRVSRQFGLGRCTATRSPGTGELPAFGTVTIRSV